MPVNIGTGGFSQGLAAGAAAAQGRVRNQLLGRQLAMEERGLGARMNLLKEQAETLKQGRDMKELMLPIFQEEIRSQISANNAVAAAAEARVTKADLDGVTKFLKDKGAEIGFDLSDFTAQAVTLMGKADAQGMDRIGFFTQINDMLDQKVAGIRAASNPNFVGPIPLSGFGPSGAAAQSAGGFAGGSAPSDPFAAVGFEADRLESEVASASAAAESARRGKVLARVEELVSTPSASRRASMKEVLDAAGISSRSDLEQLDSSALRDLEGRLLTSAFGQFGTSPFFDLERAIDLDERTREAASRRALRRAPR